MATSTLEKEDMQGVLIRSYSYLPEACYLILTFGEEEKGRAWLRIIATRLTPASLKPSDVALQLGLSNHGLFQFLPKNKLSEPFAREFMDGMIEPQRSRILGDLDTNKPNAWVWGGENQPVDAILMVYTANKSLLETTCQQLRDEFTMYAVHEVIRLDTCRLPQDKEHFGFRDGLSQPLIDGLDKEDRAVSDKRVLTQEQVRIKMANSIKPGEFILGYENEYGKIPSSPKAKNSDGVEIDLGRNGSYMVFRQLRQEVKEFWQFMHDSARTNPHLADKDPVYIASKLVGRWPNGNPLTSHPDEEGAPLVENSLNEFLYKTRDQDGFGCPIGAHIRKTNPRDGIDNDPAVSIDIAKHHRILRRGRAFGAPLTENMKPEEMVLSNVPGERGLYFICFNTNIGRQFEFIQQTWANNAKFDGLYDDVDPIIGFTFTQDEYKPCQFTIQHKPVRKTIKNIPQFVFVQGGAYFFVPGLRALRLIADAHSECADKSCEDPC